MVLAIDVERTDHKRRLRTRFYLSSFAVSLIAAIVLATGYGAVAIAPQDMFSILATGFGWETAATVDDTQRMVLLAIRLPRVCLGILTGAVLAAAGAALQGLFRNPLADPALIGISTGAALAAAAAIVLGGAVVVYLPAVLAAYLLPLAAFVGGLAATATVYRIACRDGRTEIATLLLAGIALNAIAGAGIGLLIFLSDDQQLRNLNFWLLGSLGGVTWVKLLPTMPVMAIPVLWLLTLSRQLNAFLLGETEALHLGFSVERTKRLILVLVALSVGAAVALTGVIGFVGLVVPHMVRLAIGPDHRIVLPASVLLGATLVLAADLAARTIVAPAELSIGILTSCLGGPFFLWLLIRRRGGNMP